MERSKVAVVCIENTELADLLWSKRQEIISQSPKGISPKFDTTLFNAYSNICTCKTPILSLKQLSQIKGVGKWTVKQMQGFFDSRGGGSEDKDEDEDEDEDAGNKGKESKTTRRYVPQKNSVPYALLVTLYRAVVSGTEFMRKQELIDAAEASGLSRVPIGPEKGKGKLKDFGSSPKDWYSGWNSMKTLIKKGLVAKSSCPAKYMLTEEGKEAARECITRSGLDADDILAPNQSSGTSQQHDLPDVRQSGKGLLESELPASSLKEVHPVCSRLTKNKKSVEPPLEFMNKFLASEKPQSDAALIVCSRNSNSSSLGSFSQELPTLEPRPMSLAGLEFPIKSYNLAVPPLDVRERFEEVYDVILILDDREQFTRGSQPSKIKSMSSQFKIEVEVRRLPVGDGIWIARHKKFRSEYVLDFIVERKNVDDLRTSIRDNRYKDQKLRILRCGLKKMIYLVEGDPNSSEAAESIKTACFTTEILEGFDVHRTSGLGETLRKYGYLTQSIKKYYRSFDPEHSSSSVCTPYKDFIKRCQDMEMLTVSDVFAIQLMQVPHVTEEVAMAVLDLYPTLNSLACAYSPLDGDTRAQEEMLKKQSNNLINGAASRNIFQLVWGN